MTSPTALTLPPKPAAPPPLLERMRVALEGRSPWRYPAAVAIVAATTGVVALLYEALHTTRLSMVFLAAVVIAAVNLGARPAYLAAGLSFLIYNFFLSAPRFRLVLGNVEDVIILVVFLFVAVLTGRLAGRARDDALKARIAAARTQRLYEASRSFSSTWDEAAIRAQLVELMAAATHGPCCIWNAELGLVAGAELPPQVRLAARDLLGAEPPVSVVRFQDWMVRRLRPDAPELGLGAWRLGAAMGPGADTAADADRLINIMVDLGAAAMLRARLGESRAETEALARAERLSNALLSSVSHDFRTPLAAILASASTLREFAELGAREREDLLATIQEEAERLNRFVANLLHMSRLESGAVTPDRGALDLAEVVFAVARRLDRGRDAGRIAVTAADAVLAARADPILLDHALVNVVENALAYSPPGSPVAVAVRREGAAVLVVVEDEGPGVPAADLTRIFEKFFQSGPRRAERPGAGLGLSIARGLVEAMGGAVEARNREDRPGLVVTLVLPRAA